MSNKTNASLRLVLAVCQCALYVFYITAMHKSTVTYLGNQVFYIAAGSVHKTASLQSRKLNKSKGHRKAEELCPEPFTKDITDHFPVSEPPCIALKGQIHRVRKKVTPCIHFQTASNSDKILHQ